MPENKGFRNGKCRRRTNDSYRYLVFADIRYFDFYDGVVWESPHIY